MRNVDTALIDKLKRRAASGRTSMEAAAREALQRGVRLNADERLALAQRIRAMTPKGVEQTDSWLWIREDRDSR